MPDTQKTSELFAMSLKELLKVEVTTASHFSSELIKTPASMFVVNEQQIKQRGYRHLADLIEDLPSTSISYYARPDHYNNVTMRGINGNAKFLILIDGKKYSPPAGENVPIAENFPLYYASKIEVLVGPASVIYGADAFSGVINIVTDKNYSQLSVSLGSDGYREASGSLLFHIADQLKVELGGYDYRSANNDWIARENPQIFPMTDLVDFSGRVIQHAKDRHYEIADNQANHSYISLDDVNWSIHYQSSEYLSSSSMGMNARSALYGKGANFNVTQETFQGNHQHQLSNGIQGTISVQWQDYQINPQTHFQTIFSGFERAYKYAESSARVIDYELIWTLGELQFAAGVGYDDIQFIPRGPDLNRPYNTSTSDNDVFYYKGSDIPIDFQRTDNKLRSGFVEAVWDKSESWRYSFGLRHENSSIWGSNTTPRLGMIYTPDMNSVYKLIYAQAFVAPAADTAFTHFGEFEHKNEDGKWVSFFFQALNKNLRPEQLESLEFSSSNLLTENLQFTTSVYYNRITDRIEISADENPLQFIPDAIILATQSAKNQHKSSSFGVDLGINYRWQYGQWSFDGWGYYSYLDASVDMGDHRIRLPYTTENLLKLGVTASFKENWYITARARWSDDVAVNLIEDGRRKTIAGYSLVHLHAGVNINESWNTEITVYNLLNNRYQNAVGFDSGTVLGAPQQGRSVVWSVNYQF